MKFERYQHVTTLIDNNETEGLLVGKCYLFPKLDGTNASVWLGDDKLIKTGSRNRELSEKNDNQQFHDYATSVDKYGLFFERYPYLRLYGEWLVPHSLKTYREDAWKKFYVFDVTTTDGEGVIRYVPFETYKDWLDEYCIRYITPQKIITNPTLDDVMFQANKNTFLMQDGHIGEGLVVKNYEFTNMYGRTVWGKFVRAEFKDTHIKEMGAPEQIKENIEAELVDKFLLSTDVDKVYHNVTFVDGKSVWEKRMIPQLLNTVYFELVRDETWQMLRYTEKHYKTSIINFKVLKSFVFNKVKQFRPELFS